MHKWSILIALALTTAPASAQVSLWKLGGQGLAWSQSASSDELKQPDQNTDGLIQEGKPGRRDGCGAGGELLAPGLYLVEIALKSESKTFRHQQPLGLAY